MIVLQVIAFSSGPDTKTSVAQSFLPHVFPVVRVCAVPGAFRHGWVQFWSRTVGWAARTPSTTCVCVSAPASATRLFCLFAYACVCGCVRVCAVCAVCAVCVCLCACLFVCISVFLFFCFALFACLSGVTFQVATSSLKADLAFTKLLVEVVGSLSGLEDCIVPLLASGAALHLSTVMDSLAFSSANAEARSVLVLALEVRFSSTGKGTGLFRCSCVVVFQLIGLLSHASVFECACVPWFLAVGFRACVGRQVAENILPNEDTALEVQDHFLRVQVPPLLEAVVKVLSVFTSNADIVVRERGMRVNVVWVWCSGLCSLVVCAFPRVGRAVWCVVGIAALAPVLPRRRTRRVLQRPPSVCLCPFVFVRADCRFAV